MRSGPGRADDAGKVRRIFAWVKKLWACLDRRTWRGWVETAFAKRAGIALTMNRWKRLCVVLMCFGFSLVYAAAQTQPAASPQAAAPTPPLPPGKTAPTPLPDPQTPEEFFARARALSDLEASGVPFHLKATYVASGDAEFTGNGTYEEWWRSKDLWRKEATLGDYKYVAIKNGDTTSAFSTGQYVPLRLRQAMNKVLIRIPSDAGTSRRWKLKHKKLNGVDFRVLATEEECGDHSAKVECVTQDYLSPDGVLRIHVEKGVESVYNNFHAFRGLSIPTKIMTSGDGVLILTLSIDSIELLNANETVLFLSPSLPTNMQSAAPAVDMTDNTKAIAAKITHFVQPIYPDKAKDQKEQGTVVVEVAIDATGKVREPFVIHSAGPMLDHAALDAVRQWKYSPTILNNAPVSVYTMISVGYSQSSSVEYLPH
jgi:TonB family protein